MAIPIITYNIQGRTAVNVETATMARLARDCHNIVGVKEASGSARPDEPGHRRLRADLHRAVGRRQHHPAAHGHRRPRRDLGDRQHRAARDRRHGARRARTATAKRARELHYRLFPLARAAFLETNPIPIKEAMAMAGMLEPEFRLPMCRMSDAEPRDAARGSSGRTSLVK
mgnify:CR=1 FL=1